jgi:glycosyltransferase involved in cell wall biosynthesis
MRLAIVIPGFQANEEDWCIPAFTNLARELSKSVSIHVFALRYPHTRGTYRIGKVWVHALGGGAFRGQRLFGASLLNLWRDTLRKIEAVQRKRPFDAIMGVWASESGWLATRAANLLRIPSLVHLAGGELVWLPQIGYGTKPKSLPAMLVQRSLRNASVITSPSGPMSQGLVSSGISRLKRMREWPLGVDTEMFTPPELHSTGAKPFTFVSVGSLIPVKGHDLLLHSFARLRRNGNHQVYLRVIGSGPLERQLRSLSTDLGLEGYVDFAGEVPHDKLPEVYRRADCFVIGSWHEAQCMAALEAMACGLPWIAPPVGALADLPTAREDAPTGIRVEQRDPTPFAQAMHEIITLPPEVRAQWGRNARAVIEQDYALTTQSKSLLQILSQIQH